MPFQKLLNQICSVRGVEGAAFLDSEGELILHAGMYSADLMRVVGAYQGIYVSSTNRLGLQSARTVCTLYENRSVLTQTFKDGYFITVIFSPALNFARAQFMFEEIYKHLESEL